MNMRVKHLIMLLLAAPIVLSSCKESREMELSREFVISVQAAVSGQETKAELQTAEEKKVNSLDVWIFDGETLVVHKRASGDRVVGIRAKHGTFTVYAIANAVESSVASLNTKSAVEAYHEPLAVQSRDGLFMSGLVSATVIDDSDIVVPVRRDVAKVYMKSVPQFSGIAAGGVFEVAYLINVPKMYSTTTVVSSDDQVWNAGNRVATDPEQTTLLSVPKAAPTTAVYGMPNASVEAATREDSDYVTKLVLKCTVGGSTNWYGLAILDIQSNTIYEIDKVTINRFGSDTPNSYVMDDAIDAVVTVLDWETGDASESKYVDNKTFHIYTPLTFEALSNGTITWMASNASAAGKVIEYSRDGGETWTELVSVVSPGASISVTAGEKILFRGSNTAYATSTSAYNSFGGTARCLVYGYLSDLLPESDKKVLSADYTFAYLFMNYRNLRTSETKPLVLPARTLTNSCYYGMFLSCTGLTSAPELPATTLASSCYQNMFYGCNGLISAPELPATTMANSCYSSMFNGCMGLTSVPELPAMELANSCYYSMFSRCNRLTSAPVLPATTLAQSCYTYMFSNCTGLTSAPELPATTMENYCYESMFSGCISLTAAPELPATSLSSSCYGNMFSGCTSLTTAPELPATTLASSCYSNMFSGCTNLTTAPELPATTLANNCYAGMFSRCRSLTSTPALPATTLASYCYRTMFSGCASLTSAPVLPATSLVSYCYESMFSDCTGLTSAPDLPATTLAICCYESMFSGCTSLTNAPELSVMALGSSCYKSMFSGCTSLSIAPELPATTLMHSCYESMFSGCIGLTSAPILSATSLNQNCYRSMFSGCTGLTLAPGLPATSLASSCYMNMFSGCTSLTSAPELPATTLATQCYSNMFSGCSNLSYVKAMFTTTPSTSYTSNWLSGVSSTGTFVKNAAATWELSGVSGIPEGWTVETATE